VIGIRAVSGLPEIENGDPLGQLLVEAAKPLGTEIVVVSQKVVSKAEGRTRSLAEVKPSARALELAAVLGKDARVIELVLRESSEVLRAERGVLITRTRSGLVCANAGIDASNAPEPDSVILLPEDCDASARRLRSEIETACGERPGVIIADSFGRAWRLGQADVAIGCAGIVVLDDWRGREDRDGRELAATAIAAADELAAAASLARDKTSGEPAAVISGCKRFLTIEDGPGAAALIRPVDEDLFG
jgi:coenzyme F420-0:L-glutamate ligase/coenzyme F420-1:gamma-L-glutamate ligase